MFARCGGRRPAGTSGFTVPDEAPLLLGGVMGETTGEGDAAGGSGVLPDDGI